MRKSITPIISTILLILVTLLVSTSSFFYVNSEISTLQENADSDVAGADSSNLQIMVITGSSILVKNEGLSPVTDVMIFINGNLQNYTLNSSIAAGEARFLSINPQQLGEDLSIKIIYNGDKSVSAVSYASVNTENSGFVNQSIPVVYSASIENNSTNLNGYCEGTVYDSSVNTIYYYEWIKDSELNASGAISGNHDNENYLISSIQNFTGTWQFKCMISNGDYNSSWTQSSETIIEASSDESENVCVANSGVWFSGSLTGSNYPCCGDDGALDNFYNGTLNTTNSFCNSGLFISQEIDLNQTLCSYYGYTWFSGLNKTGSYLGTYSFTNDNNGESPNGWNDNSNGTGSVMISSSFEGHNKVLNMTGSTTLVNNANVNTTFASQDSGTVEFYVRPFIDTSVGGAIHIRLYSGTTAAVIMKIGFGDTSSWSNTFQAWNGASAVNLASITNAWHHVKIVFNSATDKFDVYIDGVLKANQYSYRTSTGSIDTFEINVYSDSGARTAYFDAFGFSWDSNYEISDNLEENYFSCCGDDLTNDNFYNGTTGTASSFCSQGTYIQDTFDNNQELCESFGYDWIDNIIYPATYTFTNDEDNADPAGWDVYEQREDQVFVISDFNGKSKVLEIYLLSSDDYIINITDDSMSVSGDWNISYDIALTTWRQYETYPGGMSARAIDQNGNYIGVGASPYYSGAAGFKYRSTSTSETSFYALSNDNTYNNTWFNVKMQFISSTKTVYVYINNTLSYTKIESNFGTIEKFAIFQGWGHQYPIYYDNIDYSWDDENEYANCCGDDSISDNFYNSTNTCSNGIFE